MCIHEALLSYYCRTRWIIQWSHCWCCRGGTGTGGTGTGGTGDSVGCNPLQERYMQFRILYQNTAWTSPEIIECNVKLLLTKNNEPVLDISCMQVTARTSLPLASSIKVYHAYCISMHNFVYCFVMVNCISHCTLWDKCIISVTDSDEYNDEYYWYRWPI